MKWVKETNGKKRKKKSWENKQNNGTRQETYKKIEVDATWEGGGKIGGKKPILNLKMANRTQFLYCQNARFFSPYSRSTTIPLKHKAGKGCKG